MSEHTVTTSAGRVRGLRRDGSTVFYGLPYAEPPIGALAFAAPVPRSSWDGVREATEPRATAQCRGFAGGTIPEPSVAGDDILTVNVFTPDPSSEAGLPVLVWIHGGAYIAGSPVSPWYDGGRFNRLGIVVVTVGYRLGVTGFGLVDDAPSNRGVRDWLAALEWVRENIAAFGGDPARVTIAGQSAGGGAVLTLLGTEGIADLVQQAIAMSPVTVLALPHDARRAVAEVAELLDAEPTAASLSRRSRQQLADAPWLMHNVFGAAPGRPAAQSNPAEVIREVLASLEFSPVLDGELVRAPLTGAASWSRESPVPLLIGSASHEFNGMLAGVQPVTSPSRVLQELGVPPDTAERYVRARAGMRGGELLGQMLTDLFIRSGIACTAEGRERTWVYDFSWPAAGEVEPGRAFHCLDLPFAWGAVETPEAQRVTGEAPRALAAEMNDAWVSFVTAGSPGWDPYIEGFAVRRFDSITATLSDAYAAERILVPAIRRAAGGAEG